MSKGTEDNRLWQRCRAHIVIHMAGARGMRGRHVLVWEGRKRNVPSEREEDLLDSRKRHIQGAA